MLLSLTPFEHLSHLHLQTQRDFLVCIITCIISDSPFWVAQKTLSSNYHAPRCSRNTTRDFHEGETFAKETFARSLHSASMIWLFKTVSSNLLNIISFFHHLKYWPPPAATISPPSTDMQIRRTRKITSVCLIIWCSAYYVSYFFCVSFTHFGLPFTFIFARYAGNNQKLLNLILRSNIKFVLVIISTSHLFHIVLYLCLMFCVVLCSS